MQKKVKNGLYEVINGQLVKGELNYLLFENKNNKCIVTLVDNQKYEILKGYGRNRIEAINDLHSNLI